MTHGSLFSGIGGFDLAADWVGWTNLFHCDFDLFCQRILKYYWPNAKSYGNIDEADFTIWRGLIDVLSGGFPCQPYSLAGKRKGKQDSRHKWPQMLRAIREIRPAYLVPENVRGLINWNRGMVFDEVLADLENEGYEVAPIILPACSVNAPHRRDRVWIVAYSRDNGSFRAKIRQGNRERNDNNPARAQDVEQSSGRSSSATGEIIIENSNSNGRSSIFRQAESDKREQRNIGARDNEWLPSNDAKTRTLTNADDLGRKERTQDDIREDSTEDGSRMDDSIKRLGDLGIITNPNDPRWKELNLSAFAEQPGFGRRTFDAQRTDWGGFPTQPSICSGNDGFPAELDGITFSSWRRESLKTAGNAIVPEVAYQIFKIIQAIENENDSRL